jgi:7SK snRNA methylphosphate capping enzyme
MPTALQFSALSVTGIDKDPELIRQAQSHISFLYSRLGPSPPEGTDANMGGMANYFPISSILDHGHRRWPEPPYTQYADDENEEMASSTLPPPFPHNVTLLTTDFSLPSQTSVSESKYDIILALSVLKWIHISYQDAGMVSFFHRCHRFLLPGGRLVLEIQPWGSYEKAVKKMGGGKEDVLETLKVRPEQFGDILEGVGFLREKVVEGEALPRRIEVWKRT